ncbi:TIGR02646 family protein [Brucella intermedia]|uniref:retron system putative HNH endonuclease n=1 Tax=Brucella intermedia TaxID=94625 RepID=UPI00209B06BE|nr:retron system putative HNH endonuclease [Brucella intermedia]MCO7737481.1 TIGR02646 family protein [Brucella intermedia]
MKGSRKKGAPSELIDWLAGESEDWRPAYGDLDRVVRGALVRDLFNEQRGLCVYCGRRLDLSYPGHTFHIEHFRPRATYPALQVEYGNLFLSCGQRDANGDPSPTCGNVKADWFDESSHIEPIYSDCTSRFLFRLTGVVDPSVPGDSAAELMIDVLQLNHPELRKDRERILGYLDGEELELADFVREDGTANGYAHVAFQHCRQKIP